MSNVNDLRSDLTSKKGSKFKLIKLHHEVQGDLSEGVELELYDIVHYPTRYRMKDKDGKITFTPTKQLPY